MGARLARIELRIEDRRLRMPDDVPERSSNRGLLHDPSQGKIGCERGVLTGNREPRTADRIEALPGS